ncbi:MAG: glycine cleavage system protein H [Thermodesulfobacteriota bacterium]|nr:glycine cleavage system protein H [Thermodesulfobacteriota bacterium]
MGEKIKKDTTNELKGLGLFGDEMQCIWMRAGVVNFKLCNNAYDCNNCSFDKAFNKLTRENRDAISKGEPLGDKKNRISVNWQERFQKLPSDLRKCRHMLNGRVPNKICTNNFECNTCEYDQMLEHQSEQDMPYLVSDIPLVAGYRVPDSFYFHRGHSWARLEYGGRIRVGMDDFSMKLVGPLDDLNLPSMGKKVGQNDKGWSIERNGKKGDVLSPIEGVITAVNPKVKKNPVISNEDPYTGGWLFMVESKDIKKNLKNLLFGEEVSGWIETESQALMDMIESDVGPTAATGGLPVNDIYGNIQGIKWEKLISKFFLT